MPLYCVDKPLGITSHDVVARARRLLTTRRVGHAGTLDPLASGVLLVMSHEATKLSQFLTGHDKSYLAWVALGLGTPTLDAEGPVVATADARHIGAADVNALIPRFLALDEQRPPAFSAIKQAGERSYTAARRGDLVEPPARPVGYRSIELLAFADEVDDLPRRFSPGAGSDGSWHWRPAADGRTFALPPTLRSPSPAIGPGHTAGPPAAKPGAHPVALLALRVAAGTYVRSFARDLGVALGVPAHLAGLVRTASGRLDLRDAVPLDELATATAVEPRAALELAQRRVDGATATAIARGQRPPLEITERTAIWGPDGDLIAVLDPDDERPYRVARVFTRGS